MNFLMTTIDGVELWIVLLICFGVFFASFMDGIGGGGGIVSVPTYFIGFTGMNESTKFALGTNKLSASIGTIFSLARFMKNGFVIWRLALPGMVLAYSGGMVGSWLKSYTNELVLKYLLIVILPIMAVFTLMSKKWPDKPGQIDPKKQMLIVCLASLVIGAYDGYYGPGCGTLLMLVCIRMGKLDSRNAAGTVKVINLASNIGGLVGDCMAGFVFYRVGLIAAVASIAGHYMGAGVTIKNGSKIIKPSIIIVLLLLTIKIITELIWPEFWGASSAQEDVTMALHTIRGVL